jgi:hypothetical protein
MANNNIFRVRLVGTRPLLMSSSAGVMPRGEIGKRLKELNSLRKPTEADVEERAGLKFVIALYHDPQIGPFIPGYNLWAACRDGAKIHRLGTAWVRGTQVVEDRLPLQYTGPRDLAGLYGDAKFVDVRVGRLNGKTSIEAVRPIFPQWSLEATIVVNDSVISVADAKRACEMTGEAIGLGTFRQRFGRFDVEFLNNGGVKKAA